MLSLEHGRLGRPCPSQVGRPRCRDVQRCFGRAVAGRVGGLLAGSTAKDVRPSSLWHGGLVQKLEAGGPSGMGLRRRPDRSWSLAPLMETLPPAWTGIMVLGLPWRPKVLTRLLPADAHGHGVLTRPSASGGVALPWEEYPGMVSWLRVRIPSPDVVGVPRSCEASGLVGPACQDSSAPPDTAPYSGSTRPGSGCVWSCSCLA